MKQKAPLSNRRKTFRHLLWILAAAALIAFYLQLSNSYTPAQAMYRYEHAQLIHPTERVLQGSAPEPTTYFSFWQLGKNDEVLTFTKFYQSKSYADYRAYYCYGDIADRTPGELACVALSKSRSDLPYFSYHAPEAEDYTFVYGCINEPLAMSITLRSTEGNAIAQFETRDMTLQNGVFYFAFPLLRTQAASLSSVEVMLRSGSTQSCALANSTATSLEDIL